MRDYVLYTDDGCDLPLEYYEAHDIQVRYIGFVLDGVAHTLLDMPHRPFYDQLRAGKMPTTAQISVEVWREAFESCLAAGKDVLYIGFSSGLSGTVGSAQVAARDLMEQYPERKCVVLDSLCASLGQGLLVHKANLLRKEGASLEEVAAWVEENKLRITHMVAADDLMHLHRGGRVSKTSALAGSLLGIKPIIHMNDEGRLISIDKTRGRKQSLQKLIDMMAERLGDGSADYFMISHSDCLDEAEDVARMMSKRFGIKDYLVHFIGPVIGSHTGPGTIAVFMLTGRR